MHIRKTRERLLKKIPFERETNTPDCVFPVFFVCRIQSYSRAGFNLELLFRKEHLHRFF